MKIYKVLTQTFCLLITNVFFISCWKDFQPMSYAPVFTINGYAHAQDVGANNLIGYWAFEGSIYDSVSKSIGNSVNSGYSAGYVGQAYQGGTNAYGYSDISTRLKNLNGSFTINFWMYYNAAAVSASGANWVHFISIIDPANAQNTFDPKLQFLQYGAGNNGPATWQFGSVIQNDANGSAFYGGNLWTGLSKFQDNWVNWSLVYNGSSSNYTIYLNGSRWTSDGWVDSNTGWGGNSYPQTDQSNPPFGNIKLANVSKIVFGGLNTTGIEASGPWGKGPAFFSGALDEVRIYDAALSQLQIQSLLSLQAKGL